VRGLREGSEHPDDDTADLQFRDHREWAVGHGVAVEIPDGKKIRLHLLPGAAIHLRATLFSLIFGRV
jgi:hypothetical protein